MTLSQVNILRQSYRAYYNSSFSYNDMLVEVFYFSGRKVGFHFNCDDGNQIQGGVSKKVPACSKQVCEACMLLASLIVYL